MRNPGIPNMSVKDKYKSIAASCIWANSRVANRIMFTKASDEFPETLEDGIQSFLGE